MKTLKFKSYGKEYEVMLTQSRYVYGDRLYVGAVISKDDPDGNFYAGEPWGDVTVNIEGGDNILENESFIDHNSIDIIPALLESGIAEDTGRNLRSGYCNFHLFRFNMDVLSEYVLPKAMA